MRARPTLNCGRCANSCTERAGAASRALPASALALTPGASRPEPAPPPGPPAAAAGAAAAEAPAGWPGSRLARLACSGGAARAAADAAAFPPLAPGSSPCHTEGDTMMHALLGLPLLL